MTNISILPFKLSFVFRYFKEFPNYLAEAMKTRIILTAETWSYHLKEDYQIFSVYYHEHMEGSQRMMIAQV